MDFPKCCIHKDIKALYMCIHCGFFCKNEDEKNASHCIVSIGTPLQSLYDSKANCNNIQRELSILSQLKTNINRIINQKISDLSKLLYKISQNIKYNLMQELPFESHKLMCIIEKELNAKSVTKNEVGYKEMMRTISNQIIPLTLVNKESQDNIDGEINSKVANFTINAKNLVAQGKAMDAVQIYMNILKLSERPNANYTELAKLCIKIGNIYCDESDMPSSIMYYTDALKYACKTNFPDNHQVAKINEYLGFVYYSNKEYKLSLDHFNQALVMYTSLGNNIKKINLLKIIAKYYKDIKDLNRANKYYVGLSDVLSQQYGADSIKLAKTLTHLGKIQVQLGHKNSASGFFHRSIAIYLSCDGASLKLASNYELLASILNSKTGKKKAISNLKLAADIYKEQGYYYQMRECYLKMISLYESNSQNLVANLKKEYNETATEIYQI